LDFGFYRQNFTAKYHHWQTDETRNLKIEIRKNAKKTSQIQNKFPKVVNHTIRKLF